MSILDYIFPKQCIFCSKIGEYICKECIKKLPRALPCCCICKTLSNEGNVHSKCKFTDINIKYLRGWYKGRDIYKELEKKLNSSLFSYHIFLIKLLTIQLDIQDYIVLPLESSKYGRLNIILAKEVSMTTQFKRDTKRVCLVGFKIEDIEIVKKQILHLKYIQEVLIITVL